MDALERVSPEECHSMPQPVLRLRLFDLGLPSSTEGPVEALKRLSDSMRALAIVSCLGPGGRELLPQARHNRPLRVTRSERLVAGEIVLFNLRRIFALTACLLLLALLAGCGGGGGGGGSVGSLTLNVQWNGPGPGGEIPNSVRANIYSGNTLVATGVIPRGGTSVSVGEFGNLSSGTYRILAQAYTSTDGSGIPFASLATLLTVTGGIPTNYTTSVGTTPVSLQITPTTPIVKQNTSIQLYATPLDSNGAAVYARGSDFTWSSNNPAVAGVDANGLVTGVSVASTTIQANFVPTGVSNSVPVSVTPNSGTKTKWTILVYMNAANNLAPFSDINMNQMEFGDTNAEVRIIVQWKRIVTSTQSPWTGTRRYLVATDTDPNTIHSVLLQDMGQGVDMGIPQTLRNFVDWGMQNYPADKTVLVMWDHGSGWRAASPDHPITRAVSEDDETGHWIQTWELAQAIAHSPKIDILAWDASLMQMMEVAYEIKDTVNYVVGSEESPPGLGYPYDAIMTSLSANVDMTPRAFTNVIVQGMIDAYGGNSDITQSSIDTAQLPNLLTQISGLANVLIAKKPFFTPEIMNARNQAEHYLYYNEYKDLYDVCDKLQTFTGDAQIIAACNNVRTAIGQAVIFEAHGTQHPHSHGVSIAWPNAAQFAGQSQNYAQLAFGKQSTWPTWLAQSP